MRCSTHEMLSITVLILTLTVSSAFTPSLLSPSLLQRSQLSSLQLRGAPRVHRHAALVLQAQDAHGSGADGEAAKGRTGRAKKAGAEGTRLVASDQGSFVEVGCINTKREFIVDAHLLGELPEHVTLSDDPGTITLVGAGPGDPDLLTVAAAKALDSADLVVADRLISQEILQLVKGELKIARKLPGCAQEAQREIFRWCAEAILEGKNVVRLKIGDPFVFGRGGEEVLEFRRLGVEPKVIPGISSALAGPLAAGIPVTHRGTANRVVFSTGMDQRYATPAVAPYHEDQTAVFLMAVGRLRQLTDDLKDAGYPEDTPVGIIERATTPRERTVRTTLKEMAEKAEEEEIRPPSIIVVGEVVSVLEQTDMADSSLIGKPGSAAPLTPQQALEFIRSL